MSGTMDPPWLILGAALLGIILAAWVAAWFLNRR